MTYSHRLNQKTDKNQPEIVKALREVGASVVLTHRVGKGFGDLVVGFRGVNFLLEVKVPGEKLNDKEKEFHRDWKGQIAVIESRVEALRAIGAVD